MFKTNTVFVLGAGASYECGLPLGIGLSEVIRQKVDIRFDDFGRVARSGDQRLYEMIKRNVKTDVPAHQKAGWAIRDGIRFASSIDDFLERHFTDELMVRYGKMAIIASILEAERGSQLYIPPNINRQDRRVVS